MRIENGDEIAVFSADGSHRYWYENAATGATGTVAFVMLNPTKLVHGSGNATLAACKRFAGAWGYARFIVVNLCSILEPNPEKLLALTDRVRDENSEFLQRAVQDSDVLVAAWGASRISQELTGKLPDILRNTFLYCIKSTKHGFPAHPCRQSTTSQPIPYGAS